MDAAACQHCSRDSCDGKCRRSFERVDEGHYRFNLADLGVELIVERLRRKSDELWGEFTVRCSLPSVQTYEGALSVADLNLSSARARQDRARLVADKARVKGIDWPAVLEEFVQRVLTAERRGQPAVLLRDLPRPKPDETHDVDGFPLLARHPLIVFGDGGSAKSLFALYCAGKLGRAGVRVGYFDWEMAGEDHRERAELLFAPDIPAIRYARCTQPLAYEVDRLRRIVEQERLQYVFLDSVAFACDGPPEAAEVAGRYFRAVRQLGATFGSFHVAHISKADGADQKPFGSTFWHNGARATWFVKRAEETVCSDRINVGLYNRKANTGPQQPPLAFEIVFGADRTTFRKVDVADVADLAGQLSVRQRMVSALRRGSMLSEELASAIEANVDTVERTARRYRKQFIALPGGALGLKGADR
jgi:hypothetical protein